MLEVLQPEHITPIVLILRLRARNITCNNFFITQITQIDFTFDQNKLFSQLSNCFPSLIQIWASAPLNGPLIK